MTAQTVVAEGEGRFAAQENRDLAVGWLAGTPWATKLQHFEDRQIRALIAAHMEREERFLLPLLEGRSTATG